MVKACCVYGDGWHFVMGSLCAAFHWGALNTYRGLALLLLSWERMGPFIFQIFIWRAHVLEAEMDMIKKCSPIVHDASRLSREIRRCSVPIFL